MKKMRKKKSTVISVIAVIVLTVMLFLGNWAWKYYCLPAIPDKRNYESMEERAYAALGFAQSHRLNTHYALFVDYSVPSGTPRLYVWDFEKRCVIARTYVMHGPGGGSTAERPVFSNKSGSNCSALGRFKVTKAHGSKIRKSFRLKGMDMGNQSAYDRGLMIHRAPWVDAWCWNKYIPLNGTACLGCVTVSSRGMDYLWQLINSEQKNLLLWSYESKE